MAAATSHHALPTRDVIPAKAGIQFGLAQKHSIPAFAGMTPWVPRLLQRRCTHHVASTHRAAHGLDPWAILNPARMTSDPTDEVRGPSHND